MQEILRLKQMLDQEKIPFQYKEIDYSSILSLEAKQNLLEAFNVSEEFLTYKQIIIANTSVIQFYGSYGASDNKLEIMWNYGDYENSEVNGDMSAEEVFEEIKKRSRMEEQICEEKH